MGVRAVDVMKVIDLFNRIRTRLWKEANGEDALEELKKANPQLVQLMIDIEWILNQWSREIVKGNI